MSSLTSFPVGFSRTKSLLKAWANPSLHHHIICLPKICHISQEWGLRPDICTYIGRWWFDSSPLSDYKEGISRGSRTSDDVWWNVLNIPDGDDCAIFLFFFIFCLCRILQTFHLWLILRDSRDGMSSSLSLTSHKLPQSSALRTYSSLSF